MVRKYGYSINSNILETINIIISSIRNLRVNPKIVTTYYARELIYNKMMNFSFL